MGPPRCRFCGREFSSEYDLRRHYHDDHEIDGGGTNEDDGARDGVPRERGELERSLPDDDARDLGGEPAGRDPRPEADQDRDRGDEPRGHGGGEPTYVTPSWAAASCWARSTSSRAQQPAAWSLTRPAACMVA